MDLIEAEDIKKRWQEHTEELYKKDLHDPDDHDGVITDLEPDMGRVCRINELVLKECSEQSQAQSEKSVNICCF